jgi:flavin-dependent dehydrogenase
MNSDRTDENVFDVAIFGAGLAGLCLGRQLLLARPELRILLADRRAEIPPAEQKVGEATVQVSGYYLSRVLELEEHLLREHYPKYNLRFYWKTGGEGGSYEEFSQSYIRKLSNIMTYQLDRNVLEAEILRCNQESPGFEFHAGIGHPEVDLAEEGLHGFRFTSGEREITGQARWVVDATGRNRLFARRRGLARRSPIRHGTSFMWVEGLFDPEKMTDLSPREIRLRKDRSALGHTPTVLATNHYCGEGFWFWVIPLHGKTSLGLVYDSARISSKDVSTAAKLTDWICREFPLFARDLPGRRVVHHSGYTDFALDGAQTLSASRWAIVGEACRFTDPLYSPGGDLISIYNTLITDAILTAGQEELNAKVRTYESVARAVYEAYVPSYAVSYDTLGDQQTFSLRYTWELTVYFAFYVFPFINDLFTDRGFLPGYLRRFGRLGATNRGLHEFLNAFYHWKKENLRRTGTEPVFFDFTELEALNAAERCFYKVGLNAEEARKVLDEQIVSLEELARWTVAYLSSVVLDDPAALSNGAFVRGIDLAHLEFDPRAMAARLVAARSETSETYAWSFTPPCMARFVAERRPAAPGAPVDRPAPAEVPVEAMG